MPQMVSEYRQCKSYPILSGSKLIMSGLMPVYYIVITGGPSHPAVLRLYDSATGEDGDPVGPFSAPVSTSICIDLSRVGPEVFEKGLWASLSGAAAKGYLWAGR